MLPGDDGNNYISYFDSYYRLDIHCEELCGLAMQLYRALGGVLPEAPNETVFPDCSYDSYDVLERDVYQAAALGIVSGYEDGTFRPHAPITRQEAAAMLGRLYALLTQENRVSAEYDEYNDDAQIAEWAKLHVY